MLPCTSVKLAYPRQLPAANAATYESLFSPLGKIADLCGDWSLQAGVQVIVQSDQCELAGNGLVCCQWKASKTSLVYQTDRT